MQILTIIKRDILLNYKNINDVLNSLVFFVIVAFIFSYTNLHSELSKDIQFSISVLFTSAILSFYISSNNIAKRDFDRGILQNIYLTTNNSINILIAKIISSFLCYGVPLVIIAPISVLLLSGGFENILSICLSLLVFSLTLSIIMVLLSFITIELRNASLINLIISIPLILPTLLININFLNGGSEADYIYSNLGYGCILLPLSFVLGNVAIRNAVEG